VTVSSLRAALSIVVLASASWAQSPCAAPAAAQTNEAPQFYDEPQFTVAGVTDASQTGGHGSDTVRRTTETLTKETVALNSVHAEAADVSSLRAQVAKEPDNAAMHHALADADEKSGDALGAAREYQRAAELSPSETNLFDWGAELLLHRAYEPAGEVFAKGHRLFPKSVRIAVGLGVAAYSLASYDLAAQRMCEAAEIDPQDEQPYMFLGKMQGIDNQRFAEMAGVLLARFVRLHPENAWANYFYAVSRMRQHDARSDEARPLLEKAIRLDPKLALAHLQLGIWYADRKEVCGWRSRVGHTLPG
jgi:tetratricopeptide (TPR) repeat protein